VQPIGFGISDAVVHPMPKEQPVSVDFNNL
jgi:hypothetical protein